MVEDNPLSLKLIRVLLEGEGFEVRTAEDAQQAWAVLEQFRPRLILMDIQLPGTDGLELTRQLKSDPGRRDIPVVAITAYAMKGDEQKARGAGCDGYVTKPVDTRSLAALVRAYLNGPRPEVKRAAAGGPV